MSASGFLQQYLPQSIGVVTKVSHFLENGLTGQFDDTVENDTMQVAANMDVDDIDDT
ncbi:hypothetical protein SAMCCGM7_pA0094 (plasmid) [Sinorhizobium americanum CCGM7]|nr:hypothetical protein SAMCCGM7_pA0094 [Sinorhizobium americanum CCGM7]